MRNISYSNLLSNLPSLDEFFINAQNQLESLAVAVAAEGDKNELQLEILNKRITLSNALIKISKYKLAKLVTELGVSDFIAELANKDNSVVDYFALLKSDLELKIAYIEQDLHSSSPLNEKLYQNDIAERESIDKAYELFVKLQESNELDNQKFLDQDNPIAKNVVVEKFRLKGIYILERDVERLNDYADKFIITNARTDKGDLFSSKYNASTEALYDVIYEEQTLLGSFLLDEINDVLSYQSIIPTEGEDVVITKKNNSSLELDIKKKIIIDAFKKF